MRFATLSVFSFLGLQLLLGCGGGDGGARTDDGPTVASFAATRTALQAGESTTLVAGFSGGTGTVDNGVGPVTSGTMVTVAPVENTTYTLTVVNASGQEVTANAQVDIVFDSLSEFDGADGWILIAELDTFEGNFDSGYVQAAVAGGELTLVARQGFDGRCQSAEADYKITDSKYLAGRYSSLAVEIKVQSAFGTGVSYPTWAIGYGSFIARGDFPESAGYLLRVEWDAQGRVRVLVDGSEISPWSVPGQRSGDAGVSIFSSACSPDLGSSAVVIDSVKITAR